MDAKLVVISGKTSKRLVQLQLPAVLGRSREADVTVAHPMISRRHCEIYEQNGLLMVRDMASLNGTLIGGRKIVLAPLLPQGEFSIGPISFRVLYKFDGNVAALPAIEFAEPERGLHIQNDPGGAAHTEFEEQPGIAPFSMEGTEMDGNVDSIQVPMPDFLAWADNEDQAPPMPVAPPTIQQSSAGQPANQTKRQQPTRQKDMPTNVHPLRNLSVPNRAVSGDKLPTIPVPEVDPPGMPPIGPEYPEPEVVEPGVIAPSSASDSPWDDGSTSPVPHDVRPPQKPPHGPETADDDFGSFLEGLQ